ncbi:MAG: hypothetical protein IJ207_00145 [Treponema sp.]|uniref:hypothetical protein n=1 Tax=Treponema sp. TaxID=166 RepID=UPI0025FD3144|nr:hypothetical protein [Treponema sp.]MBQ9280597.1 hypothetical protein [Treponema sp.]
MKRRKNLLLVVYVIFALSLNFTSCRSEVDSEETYIVWTDVSTYSEFTSSFNTTLNDGYYIRLEFTSNQWSQILPTLTSEGRHNWEKSKIKEWFIGRGFGESEATKEVSWFMTISHGFIASRTGSTVYYILK